ncbi:bleomycin resistance family protein [Pseudomonas sp. GD03858]|uniref:VOC family protein n=1 Tax=unclassified Pseudomonas TaxID=196821 RepID=UPI002447F365|nr:MULTISPECIES: VOC family protein [unclassified Pseudomonas]MDH0648736.1 bleomycin resistance family protein [Pseudomonas sp. GD03867]MDH0664940.1 bleomycin resistance family protein [Pseudomonas sp. GD03858]
MPIAPILYCADLQATRTHYRDVLGFTVTDSAESTLTVQLQDCRLLFTQADLWQQSPGCSGTFYLVIDDVEGYHSRVRAGANIAWPLRDTSYGSREFGVRDCNGYFLAFSDSRAVS